MPSLDAAGSAFFFILLGGPILVAIALMAAHRHGRASATDYASLFVPALLFFVLGYARDELHTGWALIFWPVLIGVASMYLLAAKFILVDRYTEQSRGTSYLLFALLMAIAATMAFTLPPLLE